MKKITFLSILCFSLIAQAGGGSSIGPANPASLNCSKLGGTSELVRDPDGEYSNCVIEQWTLYKEMAKRGLVKQHPSDPDRPSMPNPATVNCHDIDGQIRVKQEPSGEAAYCVVEEWTLFRAIDVVTQP